MPESFWLDAAVVATIVKLQSHLSKAGDGVLAILGPERPFDFGRATRDGREHVRAMSQRFIGRRAQLALDCRGALNH
jgi:hypothetical protein